MYVSQIIMLYTLYSAAYQWYLNKTGRKKRNELPSHEKIWRKLKWILLSERSRSENVTYCMVLVVWHSGKGKTMDKVRRSVVARGWGPGQVWIGGAERIFRVVKILSVILSWWIQVIGPLFKPIECTTPRENPKVNYELCMIMMCQCRFINCNKCTTLMGDVDNRGRLCMCFSTLTLKNVYFILFF